MLGAVFHALCSTPYSMLLYALYSVIFHALLCFMLHTVLYLILYTMPYILCYIRCSTRCSKLHALCPRLRALSYVLQATCSMLRTPCYVPPLVIELSSGRPPEPSLAFKSIIVRIAGPPSGGPPEPPFTIIYQIQLYCSSKFTGNEFRGSE